MGLEVKVDLAMWAKDGAGFLPQVLKRIDHVIPPENVGKRIFVDDHSKDNSVEIAEKFGWKVYENKEGFVSGGVREALKHVTTEFFVSVEQDLVLAKNWWSVIPNHMKDPKVAIACGVRKRFPPNRTMNAIEEFQNERFKMPAPPPYCSLDNTIYRTDFFRKIGIPTEFPRAVDIALRDRVRQAGYKSVIDQNVVSYHLRTSSMMEIFHNHRFRIVETPKIFTEFTGVTHTRLLKIFMISPFRATQIMLKKKCPTVMIIYPFMRLLVIKTFHDRYVYWQRHAALSS